MGKGKGRVSSPLFLERVRVVRFEVARPLCGGGDTAVLLVAEDRAGVVLESLARKGIGRTRENDNIALDDEVSDHSNPFLSAGTPCPFGNYILTYAYAYVNVFLKKRYV